MENVSWFERNSKNTTHSVGLKEQTPFGLFDMLGNVWDIYDPEVYGSYRVFCDGGWWTHQEVVKHRTVDAVAQLIKLTI